MSVYQTRDDKGDQRCQYTKLEMIKVRCHYRDDKGDQRGQYTKLEMIKVIKEASIPN